MPAYTSQISLILSPVVKKVHYNFATLKIFSTFAPQI